MSYVPEKQPDGNRIYGRWPGMPHGMKEDKSRCVVQVSSFSGWQTAQCARKRGFGTLGEFCKQHNKIFCAETRRK